MPARASLGRAQSFRSRPLAGRVAVVAGATRGAGRGIARGLAEAGALVYCTGRSVAGNPSPYQRPETLEETVAMIEADGGRASAVRVDHTIEEEVKALLVRIDREHKGIDVVVDSVAGEDPMMGSPGWFWTADLKNGEAVLRQSLFSHIITAKHAAAVMIPRRRGLIIEVTESDLLGAGGSPVVQVVKLGLKAMALTMAAELRPHGVAALAITPGFLRSERMLEGFGVTEANWRDGGKKDPNFLESESPLMIGRAVAALAAGPDILDRTGSLTSSWEVAREFRLTDYDGRRPDWGSFAPDFSQFPESFKEYFRIGFELQRRWLQVMLRRTERYSANWKEGLRPRRTTKKGRAKGTARSGSAKAGHSGR